MLANCLQALILLEGTLSICALTDHNTLKIVALLRGHNWVLFPIRHGVLLLRIQTLPSEKPEIIFNESKELFEPTVL